MHRNNVTRIICVVVLMASSLAYLIVPSGEAVAQAGSNLVLNPGFENQGSSGVGDAADWTEGANHARSSDKFHTGGWSLRSTFRGAGTDTRTTAPVAVQPNTDYTYSGYIWRTNATGGSCMDMADLVGERQLCTKATGSWQFLSGAWNSGANTSVTLRLITDGSPTGDIWFDDISLAGDTVVTNTPVPPATNTPISATNTPTQTNVPPVTNTPLPAGNLVSNSGFEVQGSSAADAADWTEGANHTRASDKFHAGSWSLRSSFRGAGTDTRTTAPVTVQPNTDYTYSGYIWRTNTTGGACMDMADLVGERQLCTRTAGSWQFLSGAWNSGANTSVTLRLITDGSPTGDIWFDDISLAGPGGPVVTPTNTSVVPTNTPTQTSTPTSTPISPTVTPGGGGNLVLNAGFEAQGNDPADAANWTEGANHTRASDKFHAGTWSLRSSFRGAGTHTQTTAPIVVASNMNYTFSGYVWRTNATGGACMDMADLVGERQLCTNTAGSWQFLSGTWNSGANTSVTLRLITDASPTGDIWFDDISLAAEGPTPTPGPTNTPDPSGDPIIAAAGDIGCDPYAAAFNGGYGDADECHQMQVSDLLLNGNYATVLTLGDNSNADGSLYVYQLSYDPTWGRVKSITRPAVGNHDYLNAPEGDGYFTYFGAAAGERGKAYYSYDVGTWHLIVLNSNCSRAGGCGVGSPQEQWLKADLAAHPNMCTLAYWHHPRFSSGEQGNNVSVDPLWKALYAGGVELVLNGHDHVYERFAPQNPSGVADPKGIQEFIVGTGGKVMNAFGTTKPNSLVRHTNTFGVLQLTLRPTSYDWQFVPEAGQTWTDTGTRNCFTP